jgi:hypothetical protein
VTCAQSEAPPGSRRRRLGRAPEGAFLDERNAAWAAVRRFPVISAGELLVIDLDPFQNRATGSMTGLTSALFSDRSP